MTDTAARLVDRGMSPDEAGAKARIFARAFAALGLSGARGGPAFAVFVPGRIEVLGKHTDYAGGRSLLCAVERGICLAARPRSDEVVHAIDVASGTSVSVAMNNPAEAGSHKIVDPSWRLYVATVAGRLARNFPPARRGADIAFGSDLPMAAGLSSSSALVTSVLLALAVLNDLQERDTWQAHIESREDLAEYLGTVENGRDFRGLKGDAGVGTFGGSEDHTAMLCCRAGQLSQYSFCPVRHERQIPMPAGYLFVVAVSGVVAEKTGAAREAYNRASGAAREVLDRWNRESGRRDPTLRAAVQSSADAADLVRRLLRDDRALTDRFEQFVDETFTIIPEVGDRLAEGRVNEIGAPVDRSQARAEHGLHNQVPETSFLARAARELGAAAASAFGAGFGGSVWALVATSASADFCRQWPERYAAAFPQHANRARFFTTNAGPSALEMKL